MKEVWSFDPRTGRVAERVTVENTAEDVDAACARAERAAIPLVALGRDGRTTMLNAMADSLEENRSRLIEIGDRETALGVARLATELDRTCFQLRLFGEVLTDGDYLEAAIDHAGTTPSGARPDLRRMLVPIGPVAVFGASNFPLAFSVPGGDTAAALAAGCPVVVKAHPSHPATSQLCFELLADAASLSGAPEGTISVLHGVAAGSALVADPRIKAVGFTGSLPAATALLRIIEGRQEPIPLYGELSSINPVVVTPRAAEERHEELAYGLVSSFLLGGGQFCTKPGLIFVPADRSGSLLVESMAAMVENSASPILLNEGIAMQFDETARSLSATDGVEVVARGKDLAGDGAYAGQPLLLTTSAADLPASVLEECFGPLTVMARFADESELLAALQQVPPSLTTTLLRGKGETRLPSRVQEVMRSRAGRFVFDSYPTGVAVTWAQHHGGPWPATNSQHTSVGTSSVRRFLRPMAWQDAPEELLPAELRDGVSSIPRRIDGLLRLPGSR